MMNENTKEILFWIVNVIVVFIAGMLVLSGIKPNTNWNIIKIIVATLLIILIGCIINVNIKQKGE